MSSKIGFDERSDVLVIQKRVDAQLLELAKSFKSKERILVYDFDDVGGALNYWADDDSFSAMIAMADVVTTNTCGFRDYASERFGLTNVKLLPDIVDYGLSSPISEPLPPSSPTRLIWFGNVSNLDLLSKYVPALLKISDIELLVCTDTSGHAKVPASARIVFVPWRLEGFTSTLRSAHLSILTHDGLMADRMKSNNRMITSIGWGVPAIVSNTPEYARTARVFGVPECIFNGSSDLPGVVASLRSRPARSKYLGKSQEHLWRLHSPEAVAAKFLGIIDAYKAGLKSPQG